MPIRNSTTVLLTEDLSGALRADADLSGAFNNALQRIGGATPGIFGVQQRMAWTEAIRRVAGTFWTTGGTSVAFTPATMDTTVGEDDGLPASVTEDVMDASNGRIGPIDVAGYYLLGVELQIQSPAALNGQTPGTCIQTAIRTISPLQGVSVLRTISSTVSYGPTANGIAQGMPIQATNKYPWTYAGRHHVSILWPLGRGSLVEFGFRQSTAFTAQGPSSDVNSVTLPNHGYWACLVRAFNP